VKLPTGAASVSTRKADFALDLEASRDVGRFSPTLAIGYRFLGDPDFLPLEDGWSLSAGTGVTLGKVFVAASYERSEAALGGPDPQEAFLLAAGPIAHGWSWNLFASKGLSAGAADYGLGAGIARSFGRKPARPIPPTVPTR
jgi:hypothetical protein